MKTPVDSVVRLVPLLLLLLLPAPPAHGVSYVLPSDGDLADQADVVVLARVTERAFAETDGVPVTDHRIEVIEVYRGAPTGSILTVRLLGGEFPDGSGLSVPGSPELAPGHRFVLFLRRVGEAELYRPVHLGLGVFRRVDTVAGSWLLRDLPPSTPVASRRLTAHDGARSTAPRDAERFGAWLRDRATGLQRAQDYVTPVPAAVRSELDRFVLTSGGGGHLVRWFDFDEGRTVEWLRHVGGQRGLTDAQVDSGLQAALGAWNAVRNANIRFRLAGLTRSLGRTPGDRLNRVLFEDPFGDTFFDPFRCGGGGILAWASTRWDTVRTFTHDGRRFRRITHSTVVTNENTGCWYAGMDNPRLGFASLMTHEFGHALGIAHSEDVDAVMRSGISSRRGPRLGADDIAAARSLYRVQTGGPDSGPPAAPRGLTAVSESARDVLLRWVDASTGETSFELQKSRVGGGFIVVADDIPANSRSYRLGGFEPNSTHTFRLRALSPEGFSGYSNTATVTLREPPPPPNPTPPAAPEDLTARADSATEIELRWVDRSGDEDAFAIRLRSAASDWRDVGRAEAGAESFTASGLDPETAYTFEVRAENDAGVSPWAAAAGATTHGPAGPLAPCVVGEETLCLLGDRFAVRVAWRDPINGGHGTGGAGPLPGSDVSGLFTFFADTNVELIVKMLDGRGLNESFWSFYGALSTVEYWISIRDTETGEGLTLYNPPDELCGGANVDAFPEPPAARAAFGPPTLPSSAVSVSAERSERGLSGTCVPDPTTLCLLDGRFRVAVSWTNPRAPFGSGDGHVTPLPVASGAAADSGLFWFFTPDNVELVVKMLDARSLTGGGDFWWFHGGLSDVEYEIEVTDTTTGAVRTYRNEPFDLCGRADLEAF